MSMNMVNTRWNIDVKFDEDPDHTIATASMRMPDGKEITGMGRARRNPTDRPVATIGEELACARAVTRLAQSLLDRAGDEVEVNVNRGDPVV